MVCTLTSHIPKKFIKIKIEDARLNALNDFGGDQEFEDIYNELVK